MAGGWLQAGRLPADQALQWLEEHWDATRWQAWERSLDRWHMSLPAFHGEPQDPPLPPED